MMAKGRTVKRGKSSFKNALGTKPKGSSRSKGTGMLKKGGRYALEGAALSAGAGGAYGLYKGLLGD